MTITPWPDYLVLWVSCFLFKPYPPVGTDSKDGFEEAVALDLSILPCAATLNKSPFSGFHY